MNRSLYLLLLLSCTLCAAPEGFSKPSPDKQPAEIRAADGKEDLQPKSDVIARVGDQAITWSEVNIMLNSSAVVGVSIPAIGTSQRDQALIVLLDKVISANLIYLDALKNGSDQDLTYRRDVERFENAMLADLYRRQIMLGDIEVTDQEIDDYYRQSTPDGADLSADDRSAIKMKLRRKKIKARMADAREDVRKGVDVVVFKENLDSSGDRLRASSTVVAEIDGEPLTWGEVKERVVAAGKAAVLADPLAVVEDARERELQGQIDIRIMARKARAAGLDQDRMYRTRVGEYRKTHLINLHRRELTAAMEPTRGELKQYYEANRARFVQPEARKVQMVVVKQEQEAQDLKKKIESGQMTMYQAAQKYSIAPTAKQDLGEIGWVNRGVAVPALDEVIFDLGPGQIGGPVETAAGWHLVTVQDVQEPKYDDYNDATTQRLTRREYFKEKLNAYTVDLRKNEFPVVVYEDVMVQLSQLESDAVEKLATKAAQPGSITEQRVEELQKLMKP